MAEPESAAAAREERTEQEEAPAEPESAAAAREERTEQEEAPAHCAKSQGAPTSELPTQPASSTGSVSKAAGAPSDATASNGRAAPSKPAKAEKQATLGRAMLTKENRSVLNVFAAFAAGLAIVPVAGLFVCERVLRGFLPDSATRWMVSGVVAILLVNLSMASYVLYCIYGEGFPSQDAQETAATGGDCAVGDSASRPDDSACGDAAGKDASVASAPLEQKKKQ